MDRKLLPCSAAELKFDAQRAGVFTGYASTFNGLDTYGDTILPGAYKRTLKQRERPVGMRWNHFGPIIGKWTRLEEDEKGLLVEGELTPGHSVAQDVYASVKHGAVSGLSIGYRPVTLTDKGDGTRELKEIELVEISIVESPADLGAQIGDIKSAIDSANSFKELESLLRDAGAFSRTDATAIVARIKSLAHGERDAAQAREREIAEMIRALTVPTSTLI